MALLTGSVVVPGISDTKAVSCPVKALISDDFPLLRRPKRAMCKRLAVGVLLRFMAYVFMVHHGVTQSSTEFNLLINELCETPCYSVVN